MKTLVLGASPNPDRYSNMAVNKLVKYGHEVIAIGNQKGQIGEIDIEQEQKPYNGIDTVTLYLNPERQKEYIPYILSLKPRRIIANPGTESAETKSIADANGIAYEEACTLVLLQIGEY